MQVVLNIKMIIKIYIRSRYFKPAYFDHKFDPINLILNLTAIGYILIVMTLI